MGHRSSGQRAFPCQDVLDVSVPLRYPLVSPTDFMLMISYFLKAIQWARKYGLRINVDLHAVPGSQNGWNHSGRLGDTNFLLGPMGYANAQRTLDYIRIITEFISQPQYSDVVVMFGILNEPRGSPLIGSTQLDGLYVPTSFRC